MLSDGISGVCSGVIVSEHEGWPGFVERCSSGCQELSVLTVAAFLAKFPQGKLDGKRWHSAGSKVQTSEIWTESGGTVQDQREQTVELLAVLALARQDPVRRGLTSKLLRGASLVQVFNILTVGVVRRIFHQVWGPSLARPAG